MAVPTLEAANEYHSKRLSKAAWFAQSEEQREQALQSAEDLLRRILKKVQTFSVATICEQAAYMLTSEFEARRYKHSSERLGEMSVSYHWDDACGLLAPTVEEEFVEELSRGACTSGRVR